MANERVDILIDEETGNWLVEVGDFAIGDSRLQEGLLIVKASQGEYKQHPLVGCNVASYMNAQATPADLTRVIKLQLENDGLNYNEFETQVESELNG